VLRLIDTSSADRIVFFRIDACAALGRDCDVVATFQVMQAGPNDVDAGNRVVINDGISRSARATCVVIDGVRGIGLQSQGEPSAPTSYPVFVPVDWLAPVTVRLRRYANGDAELIEINGAAPDPRALLSADQLADKTRSGGTVEFGVGTPVEPECTVEYAAFWSELTVTSAVDPGLGDAAGTTLLPPFPNPSPGTIQLSFRLQDPGSVQLEIFDVSGRSVAKPPMQIRPAGTWSTLWNGSDVPAGAYWVRMSLESKEVGRKRFILLR
jgi:hypothetical protein